MHMLGGSCAAGVAPHLQREACCPDAACAQAWCWLYEACLGLPASLVRAGEGGVVVGLKLKADSRSLHDNTKTGKQPCGVAGQRPNRYAVYSQQ
jgi:hypothetical protein